MITRHVWRSVDELIVAPVEKAELRARVEIMLRARSLSLELRRQAEEARGLAGRLAGKTAEPEGRAGGEMMVAARARWLERGRQAEEARGLAERLAEKTAELEVAAAQLAERT